MLMQPSPIHLAVCSEKTMDEPPRFSPMLFASVTAFRANQWRRLYPMRMPQPAQQAKTMWSKQLCFMREFLLLAAFNANLLEHSTLLEEEQRWSVVMSINLPPRHSSVLGDYPCNIRLYCYVK
jgi:hypothetical protein